MIPEQEKLIESLLVEYKLLQDKIDKIGGFQFTIKGWSITLVIAALFAGGATKLISIWMLAGVLLIFIALFFAMEKKQINLSRSFAQRCRKIEEVITKLLRRSSNGTKLSEFIMLHYAPGIANHLFSTSQFRRNNTFWEKVKDTDNVFYLVECLVVVTVALILYFLPSQADRIAGQVITVQPTTIIGECPQKTCEVAAPENKAPVDSKWHEK
jgi:hypothetical protein